MSHLTVDIRERADSEIPISVGIYNASMPPDAETTEQQLRAELSMLKPEWHPLHVLAWVDGQAIAAGNCLRRPFDPPGRFGLGLSVRPEYRRQGVGRTIYQHLLQHARAHGGDRVNVFIHEHNLPLVEGWLAAENFRETERMRKSELNLETLNMELVAEAEKRAKQSGVQLTTLSQDDTQENRRKLWRLSTRTSRDVPHAEHHEQPFEQFEESLVNPMCRRDCLVVARVGDEFAGLTITAEQTPKCAFTWFTGVDPQFRGRGIALALKAHCARLVRERGYTSMRTFNHVNNPAMLKVNTRIGYRPLPESIVFVKTLDAA